MSHHRSRVLLHVFATLTIIVLLTSGNIGRASAATVVYVKWNAHGANTGTSWTDAYESLSTALKKAPSGSQIWVAKGTYKPTTRTAALDPRSATFTLRNKVAIYGGFKGTETLLKQRKPLVNITVLSGDIGTAGDFTDDTYHVVMGGATKSSAILDGFEIIAGYANGPEETQERGGGMYDHNASPILRNLSFVSNQAIQGGGLYNEDASPAMAYLSFISNHAYGGGGMLNLRGNPSLTNATFDSNSATLGSGMYNGSMPGMNVTNVTFYNNQASNIGGGLANADGVTTIRNATFQFNSASGLGGGIYNSGQLTVLESILWNDGSELVNDGSATATMTDTILQGGGCPSNTTCTNVTASDPLLGPLMSHGGFLPTKALLPGSPAIDTGAVNAACAPKDARGVQRPQGKACDLGAYEVNVATFKSAGALDGHVIESTQTSGVDKAVNSTASTFRVGDTMLNQQMKGILSFNTAPLPNSSSIVRALLYLTQQGTGGSDPWVTHGDLELDVAKPYFGSAAKLQAGDFQSTPASLAADTALMNFDSAPNVYRSDSIFLINVLGPTQIRLHWDMADYNDAIADYAAFYSGDASAALRPRLIVYYNP